MLVREYRKTREELRLRAKVIEGDISDRRQSLLAALALTRPVCGLNGEYLMSLAIRLNELLIEWRGIQDQIEILSHELCD